MSFAQSLISICIDNLSFEFMGLYSAVVGFDFSAMTKGQIISEQNCGVLDFPKKEQNYCKDFCTCH